MPRIHPHTTADCVMVSHTRTHKTQYSRISSFGDLYSTRATDSIHSSKAIVWHCFVVVLLHGRERTDSTKQHQCGTEAIDLYTFRLQSAGRSLNLWIFSSFFISLSRVF